jgi:hypothetical protein
VTLVTEITTGRTVVWNVQCGEKRRLCVHQTQNDTEN